jgi:hypothetical protein
MTLITELTHGGQAYLIIQDRHGHVRVLAFPLLRDHGEVREGLLQPVVHDPDQGGHTVGRLIVVLFLKFVSAPPVMRLKKYCKTSA